MANNRTSRRRIFTPPVVSGGAEPTLLEAWLFTGTTDTAVAVPAGSNRLVVAITSISFFGTLPTAIVWGSGSNWTAAESAHEHSAPVSSETLRSQVWIAKEADLPGSTGNISLTGASSACVTAVFVFEGADQDNPLRGITYTDTGASTDPMTVTFGGGEAEEGDIICHVSRCSSSFYAMSSMTSSGFSSAITDSSTECAGYTGTAPASPLSYSWTGHTSGSGNRTVLLTAVAVRAGT